jgi:chemotaxis protein methyltransferase WspC
MTQTDFEVLLKESIGLDVASIGSSAIESAVRSRMTSLGLQSTEEYWERIRASEDDLQELIETVVVPETWFFRDEEAFALLARIGSQDPLCSQTGGRLRLLSAACCTGEEPYSLAMALLCAGFSCEQLHIDAVDISRRALGRAKIGHYGANSFRGGNLGFRDRYFERTPAGYRLPDWVRDLVNFHHGNLIANDFRPGLECYDIIFCRNVLIYFDRNTQARVLQRLGSLLAPNGFLFVGPAEAFLAACNGFKSVNESMSFAFRKEGAPATEAPPNPKPPVVKLARASPRLYVQRAIKAAVALDPTPTSPCLANLENAKRLADSGCLADACDLCEAYLQENAASVESLYLLGLIRDAMGDSPRASECYRKVLYLEPSHVEALMHLALLSERRGDLESAKRLRERLRRSEAVATS